MQSRLAHWLSATTLLLTVLSQTFAAEIAITVDDLPLNGTLPHNVTPLHITQGFINALQQHNVEGVAGFVVGERINEGPERLKVLNTWVNSGHTLYNHTYSHANLSEQSVSSYTNDIAANERYISYFMKNNASKYFRFPYLSEGDSLEKRNAVRQILTDRDYTIVPASLFFSDWLWADPYTRCVEKNDKAAIKWLEESYITIALETLEAYNAFSQLVIGREIKYILLLHFNAFNGAILDKLLTAYKEKKDVKFISVEEALTDPIYQIDPKVTYKTAYPDFLVQLAHSKQITVPQYMYDIYGKIPQEKLQSVCQ